MGAPELHGSTGALRRAQPHRSRPGEVRRALGRAGGTGNGRAQRLYWVFAAGRERRIKWQEALHQQMYQEAFQGETNLNKFDVERS